jgi:threonine dehydrogenase-like Zn-dependent dehydrogenase
LAKRLGATYTIDTSDAGFSRLDDAVRSLVPTGASVAIDTTGVPAIIEQSIQSTHARGKVVYVGIPPLEYTLNINLTEHLNVRFLTWLFVSRGNILTISFNNRKEGLSLDASKETATHRLYVYHYGSLRDTPF